MTPMARLEACLAQHWWVPNGVDVVDRPALCYLASSAIPALNLVLRLRGTPVELPALVDEIHEAHRHAGSTCWVYPHHEGAALAGLLSRRGYRPGPAGDARVMEIASCRVEQGDAFSVAPLKTLDDCRVGVAVSDAAFGRQSAYTDADFRQILSLGTRAGAHRVQFLARTVETGAPVAFGSVSIHEAEGFAVLLGGGTLPAFRGRGAYRALLAARIGYARACGVRWIGLFADPTTSSPIVGRLGFVSYGRRVRWVRPPLSTDDGIAH